ncbi:MAG: FecR domain-containing protein [Opitutales bacterium]
MRRHLIFIALGICLAFTLFSQDPPQGGVRAVVEVVNGEAQYKDGDQVLPINKGMTLKEGWTVLTGAGQLVILRLANGGQLVVYENSEITLKSKDGDAAKVRLIQSKGFAWSRLPKLKKDQSFEVEMPTATAGIRGTAFSSSVLDGNASQVCVCEGVVTVRNDQGEAVLKQGELLKARSGQAMGKPMGDLKFLKHPTKQTLSCINCHQGGYSRDGFY